MSTGISTLLSITTRSGFFVACVATLFRAYSGLLFARPGHGFADIALSDAGSGELLLNRNAQRGGFL